MNDLSNLNVLRPFPQKSALEVERSHFRDSVRLKWLPLPPLLSPRGYSREGTQDIQIRKTGILNYAVVRKRIQRTDGHFF